MRLNWKAMTIGGVLSALLGTVIVLGGDVQEPNPSSCEWLVENDIFASGKGDTLASDITFSTADIQLSSYATVADWVETVYIHNPTMEIIMEAECHTLTIRAGTETITVRKTTRLEVQP